MLGGGMRQVGAVAAAGIVALETMVDRLTEDHDNARHLTERLAGIPAVAVDPESVETNIVVATLRAGTTGELLPRLAQVGVLATAFGPRRLRLVAHYGIERADIEEAADRIATVLPAAARV
jgi:threonine aldolase